MLLLLPFFAKGQTGDMRVYTIAGSQTATALGDGGPATNASLDATEGVWLDGYGNVFISDANHNRIRKVSAATGTITTIAGTGVSGYSGDNGPATNAQIKFPYGIYVDNLCNIYFTDGNSNNRIRKVDATTSLITTYAGGGTSLGDGSLATNAQLTNTCSVYGDNEGNIYIGELGRIRKINSLGIISTIAGNGIPGLSGDLGPATSAQIHYPSGMLFDASGNLLFADRSNSRIRKISSTGIIATYAGTTDGFSGDNEPATVAQLSGPISFVIDNVGNVVIGDNQNNCIRKVDAITGIITTIAGIGPTGIGNKAEGAPAIAADIHPEFMYLDRSGNIYYSCYCNQIRKITNYIPGLPNASNYCGETSLPGVQPDNEKMSLFPNPATDELHIKTEQGAYNTFTITNSIGQKIMQQPISQTETSVPIHALRSGIYFITFKGEHGVQVQRFVKE